MITKATDLEYEDHILTAVRKRKEGWEIDHGHLTFWIPKEHGVTPHKGDTARFYGRGLGYVVRGVDLNGVEVFYRTPEEQELENQRQQAVRESDQRATFASNQATLDAQYASLPAVFQARLDRFRRNNPDFRWRYEAYEMSCCLDAVKIAAACPTADAIKAFYDLPWERQQAMIPDLYDGHSGNSFGTACRLARTYNEQPDLVPLGHGALCALVGCEDYGCAPLPTVEEVAAAEVRHG